MKTKKHPFMSVNDAAGNVAIAFGRIVGLEAFEIKTGWSETLYAAIESMVVLFKAAGVDDEKVKQLCSPYQALAGRYIELINKK